MKNSLEIRTLWPLNAMPALLEACPMRTLLLLPAESCLDFEAAFLSSNFMQQLVQRGVEHVALVGKESESAHDLLDWHLQDCTPLVTTTWHAVKDVDDVASTVFAAVVGGDIERVWIVADKDDKDWAELLLCIRVALEAAPEDAAPDRGADYHALQVLAFMVFVCGACANTSQSERKVMPVNQDHIELPDADAVVFPVGSPWRQLSASVKVQPDQQNRGRIELTLEILNESESAIRIRDPLDTFFIDIFGPDGRPLALPQGPPRFLINTKQYEPTVRAYTVLRVHNSLGRELMAQLESPEMTLPPGSAHWIDILVDRVSLGKGEHRVRFALALLSTSGTEHKKCVSQLIKVIL